MLVYQRVLDGQKQDLSNLPSMYSILDSWTLKWDVELPLWHWKDVPSVLGVAGLLGWLGSSSTEQKVILVIFIFTSDHSDQYY